MDLGYLVCLDTYCFGHGFLTAMDLDSDELIQVDYHGHQRRDQRGALVKWAREKWRAVAAWLGRDSEGDTQQDADSSGTETAGSANSEPQNGGWRGES